ncbi:hypothetical protein LG329_19675 (plasmid) [Virgibacillus necropolis]|uniref:hypothetical protein n=1 Tax=Virgibacillus necropolis TaxID=163877 RepID=UPI00384BFE8C
MSKKYFSIINILLVVGLFFILKEGFEYEIQLEKESAGNFDPTKITTFQYLFPILIGVYLSLFIIVNMLITTKSKKRNWAFDWLQFFTITVPVAIIIFSPYIGFERTKSPLTYFILCIVLGYSLITSIKKHLDND